MTSRADLFGVANRWATRGLLSVQALHQGFRLGLMEPADLQAATLRHCRAAPPGEVPLALGSYDAVILGWGAYSHVAGRAARVRLLVAPARHLEPQGPFLFSFLVRPAGSGDRFFRWVCATARLGQTLRRSQNPVEVGDTLPGYFAHRFTRAEIESEVAAAGLGLERYVDQEYGAAVVRAMSPPGLAQPGERAP